MDSMKCQSQPSESSRNSFEATTLHARNVLPFCYPESFGHPQYIHKATTESTNDDARNLIISKAPHGTLVVANTQTLGRGRHDRNWASPPDTGIYASLLLFPERPITDAPLLGIAAAVAACHAIQLVAAAQPNIKWPNDILLHGQKIAGILAETEILSPSRYAIMIGIGMNVNTPPEALPERARFPASSLRIATGYTVPRNKLLAAWLDAMTAEYARWNTGQHEPILSAWQQLAYGLGQAVTIAQDHTNNTTGTLIGIAPDGALLLSDANRNTQRIITGDLLPIA